MGFSRFNLSTPLLQSIASLGYAEPTPIQAQAIPVILNNRDLLASAQTGTGKTCAFVVPLVERLLRHADSHRPSVLILTPTRELAAQIQGVTQSLIKNTRIKVVLVVGGTGFGFQLSQLRHGADIIVATPGRLMDHLQRRTLSLKSVKTVVLDEADRMLDMGFLPNIRQIMAQVPSERQTMLFSATFGSQIKQITAQFLRNPEKIELTPASTAPSENITQCVYPVSQNQKKALLQAILELSNMTSAIIFTRTKHGADKLLRTLQDWGKNVAVIHSNRSQQQRQRALEGFKHKHYQILVATDIAARGIDVKDISHVINYDVPRHAEDYVHRIGRTGRAQAVGEAFTLVSPEEEPFLKKIESFIRKPIVRGVIPDFPYETKPHIFSSNQTASQNKHAHKPSSPKSAHHHGPKHHHHGPARKSGRSGSWDFSRKRRFR